MERLTISDLHEHPSYYVSSRHVGDVLIGEDTARPLVEASSSGNDIALRNLLSQPEWINIMLEKPHLVYNESISSNDTRQVLARRIPNIERCLKKAAENGHATVSSTILAFAKDRSIDGADFITRSVINSAIGGGQAAVFKALASTQPNIVNFSLAHGALPLYEAVRLRKPDVVAILLELGADPSHPVQNSKILASYHSSLMSHAAFGEGPRTTEMLLKHGATVEHTGALHTAAACGEIDTMRLLMQHGADVNEVLHNWHGWTPMHFAASKGKVDAMKLLEEHKACSDTKGVDGKTASQLLEEYRNSQSHDK